MPNFTNEQVGAVKALKASTMNDTLPELSIEILHLAVATMVACATSGACRERDQHQYHINLALNELKRRHG